MMIADNILLTSLQSVGACIFSVEQSEEIKAEFASVRRLCGREFNGIERFLTHTATEVPRCLVEECLRDLRVASKAYEEECNYDCQWEYAEFGL